MPDAYPRLLTTLVSTAALAFLSVQPLHGLAGDAARLSRTLGLDLLSLGIVPVSSAFLVVELIAVAVPGLRARRVGNDGERASLHRAAWILSVPFSLAFAMGLVLRMGPLGETPSGTLAELGGQLVGGELVTLLIAAYVSHRGLCNGLALAFAVDAVARIVQYYVRVSGVPLAGAWAQPGTALGVLVCLAACVLVMSQLRRSPAIAARPAVTPLVVSGLNWFPVAANLATLPLTLASAVSGGTIAANLLQERGVLGGVTTLLGTDLVLLAGFLYFRPRAVARIWKRWLPDTDESGVAVQARSLLPRALAVSWAVNVGVGSALGLLSPGRFSWVSETAFSVLLVGLLTGWDIVESFRARLRLGTLARVRAIHRTSEVEPATFALTTAGVEVVALGGGFRSTQQIFAPYAPVELWVPVAQLQRAHEAIGAR